MKATSKWTQQHKTNTLPRTAPFSTTTSVPWLEPLEERQRKIFSLLRRRLHWRQRRRLSRRCFVLQLMSWDQFIVEERLAVFRLQRIIHSILLLIVHAACDFDVLACCLWTYVGNCLCHIEIILVKISRSKPIVQRRYSNIHTAFGGPGRTPPSPRYLGLVFFSAPAVRSGCCGSDIPSNLIGRKMSSFGCL